MTNGGAIQWALVFRAIPTSAAGPAEVSHSMRLCRFVPTDAARLRAVLRATGMSLLSIRTDLPGEDREQIKTRVEAFLEVLK